MVAAYMHTYFSPLAGVAVATAFCPLESAAVVNTGDWVFGVPPTGKWAHSPKAWQVPRHLPF